MFNVLALGEFIQDDGIEIAIGAFAELYQTVTSKHQKKMEMTMITKGLKTDVINQKTKEYNLTNQIKIVSWHEQEVVEACYQNASVLLLPSNDNLSKLVSESFSFGLPVISYKNQYISDIVDQTCGMLITPETQGEDMQEFSNMLRMLYFDPEARKILKKGAMNKYNEALSWGNSQKVTSDLVSTT